MPLSFSVAYFVVSATAFLIAIDASIKLAITKSMMTKIIVRDGLRRLDSHERLNMLLNTLCFLSFIPPILVGYA